MASNYEIDNLDLKILGKLQNDSRKSYEEIARELVISGGTIHVRVKKLKEQGIIKGSKIIIDYKKMGFDICAFIGINLHTAKDYKIVISKLEVFPEIIESHYTTGKYNIFTRLMVRDMGHLHRFLTEKLQNIKEIHSTETLLSLDIPIDRDPKFY